MTLDECRSAIGLAVIYTPAHGEPETGTITSVSSQYAFVQYHGDRNSKATHPDQLKRAHRGSKEREH